MLSRLLIKKYATQREEEKLGKKLSEVWLGGGCIRLLEQQRDLIHSIKHQFDPFNMNQQIMLTNADVKLL